MSDKFNIPAEEKTKVKAIGAENAFPPDVLEALRDQFPGEFADKKMKQVEVTAVNKDKLQKELNDSVKAATGQSVPEVKESPQLEFKDEQPEKPQQSIPQFIPPSIDLESIKITEEEEDKYFKSVIDSVPYSETYEFFKGKMKVTYRTRTVSETQSIARRIAKNEPTTTAELDLLMSQYNMAFTVVSIVTTENTENFNMNYSIGDDDVNLEDRLRRFNFPSQKYMVILKGMYKFENKVAALAERSVSSDF